MHVQKSRSRLTNERSVPRRSAGLWCVSRVGWGERRLSILASALRAAHRLSPGPTKMRTTILPPMRLCGAGVRAKDSWVGRRSSSPLTLNVRFSKSMLHEGRGGMAVRMDEECDAANTSSSLKNTPLKRGSRCHVRVSGFLRSTYNVSYAMCDIQHGSDIALPRRCLPPLTAARPTPSPLCAARYAPHADQSAMTNAESRMPTPSKAHTSGSGSEMPEHRFRAPAD